MLNLHVCWASFHLWWASFRPFTANSAFHSRNLWKFCISQWLHTVLIPISFAIHVCTSFLDANTTYNSTAICNQFPGAKSYWSWSWQGGNMSCCWMLAALDATECRGKLRSSEAAIVASYSCAKLMFRDGRLIDAELGLITCVWDRTSRSARESIPERSSTGVKSDSSW